MFSRFFYQYGAHLLLTPYFVDIYMVDKLVCMLRMRVQWFKTFCVSAYFCVVSRQKGKTENGYQDFSVFKNLSGRDSIPSDVEHRKETVSSIAYRRPALPLSYCFVTES